MLQITQQVNPRIDVGHTASNLDGGLTKEDISPLPNYAGFSIMIAGSSGSGKTNLLYSMFRGKKNGHQIGYAKLFDYVYIISPTLGGSSVKKDIFKSIPDGQKYKELTLAGLTELEDQLYENKDDGKKSIVILDDVGSQLRRSAGAEKKLVQLIQNRRHAHTSYIFLVQKFKDTPTGIRNNCSHIAFFRPKNQIESMAITSELMPFDTKKNAQILSHVFDDDKLKFPFIFIDMSLKQSNKYLFYNAFNPMIIDDTDVK